MKIHESPISGKWYPSASEEMLELAVRLFHEADDRSGPILRNALGFVVPHAGLVYSGRVAAAAYRHIQAQQPRRVVLLGFSHSRYVHGIAVPDVAIYATPLGEIAVDREAATRLQHYPPFRLVEEAAVCDHSIEIQLPLLAHAHHDARLIPLCVGDLEAGEREEAARVLAGLLDGETVILASSDFTHFGRAFQYQPFPVNSDTPAKVHRLDAEVIDAASSLNQALFQRTVQNLNSTTCGTGPIRLLLETLRQIQGAEIYQRRLDYETSGDRNGDYHHSVSYACLGYFPQESFALSEEAGELLCRLVWNSVLKNEDQPTLLPEGAAGNEELMQRHGLFVTIYREGQLQGCTGCVEPNEPLLKTAPATTASTLRDPRFERLRPGQSIDEIEISLLTPLRRISHTQDFIPGVDGLQLDAWNRRALLLPQVAESRQWDRKVFLSALAQKAGLPNEIYTQADARLYRFRVTRLRSHRGEVIAA